MRGYVDGCTAYYPQFERVAVRSYSGGAYEFGVFRRYTTQELIEKGKAQLGDTELSESKKMQYGLN